MKSLHLLFKFGLIGQVSRERNKFFIREKLLEIYERDNWECCVDGCTNRASQVAHRIANTKYNRISLGKVFRINFGIDISDDAIINHPCNLRACCGQTGHNDSFNVGQNPFKRNLVLKEIVESMLECNQIESNNQIEEFLRGLE